MARDYLSLWPQALLCGYWLALLVSTHWPRLHAPEVPGKDKTLHVIAYAILAGLLLNLLVRLDRRRGIVSVMLMTLVLVAVGAALDEWTQPYFGRTCDLFDWLADMAGGAVASGLFLLVSPGRRQAA